MKIQNTEGILEYILTNIGFSLICCVSFNAVLMRQLDGLSYDQSRMILLLLIGVCIFLGTAVNCIHNRNNLSSFAVIVLPFGIFTLAAYATIDDRNVISTTLVVCVIISILCGVLILGRHIQNKNGSTRNTLKRIMQTVCNAYYVFAIGLFVIMLHFGGEAIFGSNIIIEPTVAATAISETDSQIADNNMDIILQQLHEENWNALTVQQKVDVLQSIANIEREYLGIPHELHVGAANLGEHTLGTYSDAMYMVKISLDSLANDPVEEVLNSLCHEAHHAYTHALVSMWQSISPENKDLKIFDNTKAYSLEYDNYQHEGKAYREQWCESHAREYAEERLLEYLGITDDINSLVEYDENNHAFLLDASRNRIAGPYKYIEDSFDWAWMMSDTADILGKTGFGAS